MKMIERSEAKSHIPKPSSPRETKVIEFEESCALCDLPIPNGAMCLRKRETNKILCILCLVEIAVMNKINSNE